MPSVPAPRAVSDRFWDEIRAGASVEVASARVGFSHAWGRRLFRKAGGVNPVALGRPAGRYLSLAEREEILHRRAAGQGVRAIARALGRDPATICRELKRGAIASGAYRPSMGQHKAELARSKPRGHKLADNLRLRREVVARLKRKDSPRQIAGRLKVDFPDDPEMRVCAETIYKSLFVQGRGTLKKELTAHLRTGRALRKPRGIHGDRGGRLKNMVMISERPAEVQDRAVPGHWEGDLIMGSKASGSSVGTLVERTTGFVILLHLPGKHTALAVQEAIVAKMNALPELLRRSLTWDQGKEMANHLAIAAETGLQVYFCDPHAPWQRGTNENTNGLLRQYLPKGTDLSFYGPGLLDNIANELNTRPRERHGFRTPAEVLDRLLSEAENNPGVA